MTAASDVSSHAIARARWRPAEIAFWILAASCAFLFPSRYLIMTDIVRLALFALSLDLILGYAGIVSLGHAAFFGVGAYSAGLLALHGIITEPVIALVVAGLVAMVLGFLTSFLVIRGVDLTRLMVTLGIGDVAGKYYVPKMGPFVIYTIMIVILIWRPNGLFGRTAAR
jgi:branched-chain amino acid transport system permease protein